MEVGEVVTAARFGSGGVEDNNDFCDTEPEETLAGAFEDPTDTDADG